MQSIVGHTLHEKGGYFVTSVGETLREIETSNWREQETADTFLVQSDM